ncbi:MAG: Coenzyme F420 hydrogenase/dehydrogenase, beta subunit C-terminal domain [Promethearchaeota archaeon]
MNSEVFGKQPQDPALGNCLKCYVGHSNDEEVRFSSSSGGIVTELLAFALENGLIDGALVTRMKKDCPLETEPIIATTREEIVSASKSKYCPAAPSQALGRALKANARLAFVGLPCHIHGVRKAEANIKALKEKIVLHVGIMCSHTVSFRGTEFLLEKLGVSPEQVEEIAYRGQGWPGSLLLKLKSRSNLAVPYVGDWNAYEPVFSCFFFTPWRCLACYDESNELADISLGDAWLPVLKKERKGKSIIVVRTRKGEEILNRALSAGAIHLEPVRSEKVKCSQAEPLKFKKTDISVRLAMIQFFGRKTPNFTTKHSFGHSPFSWIRNLYALSNVKFSDNHSLRKLLIHVPFPIIRLYYGVYKLLCDI